MNTQGRFDESLNTNLKVVALRRQQATRPAGGTEPQLAFALNRLAEAQSKLQLFGNAIATQQEAVELWSRLAAGSPEIFELSLAGALTNLSIWLAAANMEPEALIRAEEGVAHFRAVLSNGSHLSSLPNYAIALTNLALRLSHCGRHEEAISTIHESIELRQDLQVFGASRVRLLAAFDTWRRIAAAAGMGDEYAEAVASIQTLERGIVDDEVPASVTERIVLFLRQALADGDRSVTDGAISQALALPVDQVQDELRDLRAEGRVDGLFQSDGFWITSAS